METEDVKLPSELLKVANLEQGNLSQEAARLLALELYREDRVSLGRAAETGAKILGAFHHRDDRRHLHAHFCGSGT